MRSSFKKLLAIVVLFQLLAFVTEAQLNHFIYIQSDNKQPFYIKYNSKIISSTSGGYIILSKLNDGVISFSLGFPQSNEAEQKFTVTINNTEKGYLIKQFAEKGWGLFDLQSTVITYAQTNQPTVSNNSTTIVAPANDPFANMLSTVTQDSTVKNVVVKKEEKPLPPADSIKLQPPVTQTNTPKIEEPKKEEQVLTKPIIDTPKAQEASVQPAIVQEPQWIAPPKSSVQRIRRFDSREGVDLVFEITEVNGVHDTVRLFIAADSLATGNQVPVMTQEVVEQKKDSITAEPLPQSPLNSISQKEEVKVDTPVKINEEPKIEIKNEPTAKPVSIPNSNCKEEATEDDFLKLRKRMASQNKEEAMVNEAKKVFKSKCFSTAQLKNLAVLFLTDEWRYRFYDAALPFVSDFSSFKLLGDTITDDYYKKRFQALLPNQ